MPASTNPFAVFPTYTYVVQGSVTRDVHCVADNFAAARDAAVWLMALYDRENEGREGWPALWEYESIANEMEEAHQWRKSCPVRFCREAPTDFGVPRIMRRLVFLGHTSLPSITDEITKTAY